MSLALYGHPFSSYTQKALIALYENATPFEFRCIGPDTPEHAADWLRRWPMAKFPLLLDGERQINETSIIIEYLQFAHPGPVASFLRTRWRRSMCVSSTASSTCT
jgi:glutathione S-transferase